MLHQLQGPRRRPNPRALHPGWRTIPSQLDFIQLRGIAHRTYPGYLSSIEKDFNRAGEKAWVLGFSYDLRDYVKGLSLTFNFVRGTDAVDPATKSGLPDETEYDITLDYRIEQGPLRGMWVRMRNAYVDFSNGGGRSNNVCLIINDPLALL